MAVCETTFKTLSEQLGAIGLADLPGLRSDDLDRFAEVGPAFDPETGRIYVHCGGECILRVTWIKDTPRYDGAPVQANRRPGYVVLDASAHDAWQFHARQARAAGESTMALGPCPSKTIRFAYSG